MKKKKSGKSAYLAIRLSLLFIDCLRIFFDTMFDFEICFDAPNNNISSPLSTTVDQQMLYFIRSNVHFIQNVKFIPVEYRIIVDSSDALLS